MANATPLRDPAYQLFIQESLELLLQIDTTLQEVLQIPSKTSMDFLLDMTQTLNEGAQSFNLTNLYRSVQTFEGLMVNFQQDPLGVTPDEIETLKQAYKDMQTALVTYIPGSTEQQSLPASDAEPPELTPPRPLLALPEQSDNSENDVTTLILTTDVAESLEQLHQVLINPQVYDLAEELRTHTEALLGWGEVLELNEFVTIAQSTLTMLDSNPQASISIGQLSLAGFQSAYKTALQDQQTSPQTVSSPRSDEIVTPRSSQLTTGEVVAETPTAESLSSLDEVTLNTTLLFVWQHDTLLFTIPSDAVVEMLIPRAEQMMGNEHQRCLSWQQQFIPIHRLVDLLQQEDTDWPHLTTILDNESDRSAAVFGKSPLIVVQQGGQTLALEVEITRLVTEPELSLQISDEQRCPYYCGHATLAEGQEYGVIDIPTLLSEVLSLSPMPIAKAVPSTNRGIVPLPNPALPPKSIKRPRSQTKVLVVDDSQTVRMMVNMVLEGAGYQVLEAADGQLAIEQLKQHEDIHLILCDVEMPNINGFEFLEYRCRQPAIANIPVVMLSTCSSTQHRHLANTLGANAYLTKPYEDASLLATLQALIR